MFINDMYLPVQTRAVINYSVCENIIKQELSSLNGFYKACCGYSNFSSVLGTIAVQKLGIERSELNWVNFDNTYEKLFYEFDYIFLRAWLTLFKYEGLKKHIKEITTLLHSLCQVN